MPLSNAPTHLKEMAQQGKPEGITGVLNHFLEPQGVSAQAAMKNGSLLILLESEEVPHQETLVPFIHAGLVSLGIESSPTAKIGGRQKGGRTVWQETVDLENPPEEIAYAAQGMPDEDYGLPEEDSDMPYEDDDLIPEGDLDDPEGSEDYEDEDIDEEDEEEDEEQEQKNKKQNKSPLMLLVLLLMLVVAGVVLFFVPGPLRGFLPFLSEEETPAPGPAAGSAPEPAGSDPEAAANPEEAAPVAAPPANAPSGANPEEAAPVTAAPANAPSAAPEATPAATQASVELIGAVRKANKAWELTQKIPQSEQEWNEIATLWEEGSEQMKQVPPSDPKYEIAQNRIVLYQKYAEFARQMADLTSQ